MMALLLEEEEEEEEDHLRLLSVAREGVKDRHQGLRFGLRIEASENIRDEFDL